MAGMMDRQWREKFAEEQLCAMHEQQDRFDAEMEARQDRLDAEMEARLFSWSRFWRRVFHR